MVYRDRTIIGMGDTLVDPFVKENVSASSIDLTLGDTMIDEDGRKSSVEKGGEFVIRAGEFCLMSTNEKVMIPTDAVGIVKGKSSLARKGLMIECAGVCDAGFEGRITLEVKNLNQRRDIVLTEGMKICQVVFFEMDGFADSAYSNEGGHHYQGQMGTTKAWDDAKQAK